VNFPGGSYNLIEVKQAIKRIEHLLVTNEFSDRVFDLRDGDTKKVGNLLAYRKVGLEGDTEEFWVPPTVFDKEFVVGVNKAELVKELQRLGWLSPPRQDGKTIHTRSVHGKRIYFCVFGKRENGGVQGVRVKTFASQGFETPVHSVHCQKRTFRTFF
jgi:putative DNA primase/helicase